MTKRNWLLTGLGLLLAACGGSNNETVDVTPSSDAVPSDAVLIDTVHLQNGEELSFFDATTAEDESPAIIVSRLGDNSRPEFELELYQRAHYPITPAELWREATGDDQIPDELLQQHVAQALDDDRPNADLQDFDAETEKAFFPSVSQMFPLDSNSTGLVPTSGCWKDGGIRVVEVGPGAASNAYSMCASNGNGVRAFSIDAGCDPVLNTNTTIRVASFNGGIQSFKSKWCWASNNDQMSCIADVTLNPNFFHGASFYKNGTKHRMGIGSTASTLTETFRHSSYYLASATLNPTGIKRFEDTGCTAFTENFPKAMNRIGHLLVWGLLVGCSGPDDTLSPEEVKKDGRYCCFHDGAATTPECAVKTQPGGVWLTDYSNVTPDGRGDSCGWILDR